MLVVFLRLLFLAGVLSRVSSWSLGEAEDGLKVTGGPSGRLIQRFGLNPELFGRSKRDRERDRPRRRVEAIFKGHPKPRAEILANKFHMEADNDGQRNSLVALINKIAAEYLVKCPPIIYYDRQVQKSDAKVLELLFRTIPVTFYHGDINDRYQIRNPLFRRHMDNNCKSYILFLSDPMMTRKIIGSQTDSRVVVISRSSQWKLRDFLSSDLSSNIVNLLVIGESLMADPMRERPYVLYTHKLYADGLGSNTPVVLTSWIRGMLSRPHINLFPPKFENGFAGHRFQVGAANQPPFVFRINILDSTGTTGVRWEGVEYRLLQEIAAKLNFSIEITEPPRRPGIRGVPEAMQNHILSGSIDVAMSGIYVTEDRLIETEMSVGHSKDCAAFITLASKALPKYRAIMGPFQWPVWVALTCVYLGAIFPIVYTDRLSLKHLIGNWGEIENMFWYVFGMFTNSFTFSGQYSWGNSQKTSTRLLIGSYWIFTIIITACYTGSIIAFVTLPAFPDTVDSVLDLLGLFFRVGTLDNSGWEKWFHNSTHVPTAKLFKKMEYVSALEEGIGNVTQSFFWNYAFLGSKSQLEYLVQSNYSDENISRRSALHLSEECFALFQIGYLFPRNAVYKRKIDSMILLAQQSGLVDKIRNEVSWTMQRSSGGKLLQASSSRALGERIQEERQLTTADTEGMFLLMGIGYLMGAIALVSEIVGGITNKCRQIIRRSRKSFSSGWSSRKNSSDESESAPPKAQTEAQQRAHLRRKEARRKVAEAEKNRSFGMREFNLTKTTLKELYGNYHKSEPNYVVKGGKLILENDAISTDSTDCNSSNSSASGGIGGGKTSARKRPKAMVLAHVDVDNISVVSEPDCSIQESLAVLDNYLLSHVCDDISEENMEDLALEAAAGVIDGGHVLNESSLFGSYVLPEAEEEERIRIERLNLFAKERELEEGEEELREKEEPKKMEESQEEEEPKEKEEPKANEESKQEEKPKGKEKRSRSQKLKRDPKEKVDPKAEDKEK